MLLASKRKDTKKGKERSYVIDFVYVPLYCMISLCQNVIHLCIHVVVTLSTLLLMYILIFLFKFNTNKALLN